VYLLHECGYHTGIDLEALAAVARSVQDWMGKALPGQYMRSGPRLKLTDLSSMRRAVG